MRLQLASPLIVLMALSSTDTASAQDLAKLNGLLPSDANAAAVIHVKKLLNSPKAVAEKWRSQAEEKFLSGAGTIPPNVDTVAIASLVRPGANEEVWSVMAFPAPVPGVIKQVARMEQAPTQTIKGHAAVRSHRDAYVVEVDGMIAVRRPAVRQETAKWIAGVGKKSELNSAFLRDALQTEAHIVLAADLEDTVDPARGAVFLRTVPAFKTDAPKRIAAGKLLKSLAGVSLRTTVTQETQVEVDIQFREALDDQAGDIVKPLFLAVLDELGAAIPEFEQANVRVAGNTATLATAFSDESFRRLLTLIAQPPHPHEQQANAAEPPKEPSRADRLKYSKKYLASANRTLDDLRRLSSRAKDYAKTAMWHDNAARKIDNLPAFAVDSELLEYGAKMSKYLRALAASLRGEGVKVNAQAKSVTYNVNYNPGWGAFNIWGGAGYQPPSYNVESNLQQVREKQAATIAAGADDRTAIWKLISNAGADIKRSMRKKYGPSFD